MVSGRIVASIRSQAVVAAMFAMAAAMVLTHAASAAGGATSLTVSSGQGLTIESAPGADEVALRADVLSAGRSRTYYLPLAGFAAADTSGTGNGWHVTLQASRFIAANGDQLPAGSLAIVAPAVVCPQGATCLGRGAPPVVTGGYPAPIDDSTALTVASALVRTGMGRYEFLPGRFDGNPTHNLALTVDAGASPETYSSIVSISIVSGP
jgi:hypothetical protein